MGAIATHGPMDLNLKRVGMLARRPQIRSAELDISGELDGHVINRKLYVYGGSIRAFAYQWAVEKNRAKNRAAKYMRKKYMLNRLAWQEYYMYAKDKRLSGKGGYIKTTKSGRKEYVSSSAVKKGKKITITPKTEVKKTANVTKRAPLASRSITPFFSGPRKCLVKIRFTTKSGAVIKRNNAMKIAYIARKEATIDSKPFYEEADAEHRIYTFDENGVKKYVSNEKAAKELGQEPVFRIIISPEDKNVDLAELAKRYMKESFAPAVGSENTLFFAANHYNTEHPHVHIIVSRRRSNKEKKSGKGKYLAFSRDYLRKNRAQRDASRILTDFMGMRTTSEEKKIAQSLVRAKGYTHLDRELHYLNHPRKDGTFWLSSLDINRAAKRKRPLLKARLQYLMSEGKVEYESEKKAYIMHPDWNRSLKKTDAVKNSYVNEEESEKLVFDEDKRTLEGGQIEKGKIKSFKISEEDPNLVMFVIEDEKGALHLIEEEVEEDIDMDKLKDQEVLYGFKKNARVAKIINFGKLVKELKKEERTV